MTIELKKGLLALSPLAVFILLYLVTSIIARDFYKVPITVAFMAASAYAVVMSGGVPLRQRIDIYSRGAATGQMMLMFWIFFNCLVLLVGYELNISIYTGSIHNKQKGGKRELTKASENNKTHQ